MSVNRFKNGVLQKIAGAVGDAVPLINNFLTNQPGKGAADANTVYQLKNEIDSVNDSLGEQPSFVYDENGKITGYTTKIGGADTVFPFSGGFEIIETGGNWVNSTTVTVKLDHPVTNNYIIFSSNVPKTKFACSVGELISNVPNISNDIPQIYIYKYVGQEIDTFTLTLSEYGGKFSYIITK